MALKSTETAYPLSIACLPAPTCSQSYAGGRNLWGTAPTSEAERSQLGLKEPSSNDGQLEVRCSTV